ncbi:hypothetical protein C2S53_013427 [Perilla frutescens var. hirtella]|uniref:non-specific serine/threonine protein kinase n=1 Tax=Perilla frutescens var. hirtella TaxID=608512 RepID=A0AAD4PF58_PERFH|nr:hypothetical protein C2S53_013427 [Perilla frutescens var. hirtella]
MACFLSSFLPFILVQFMMISVLHSANNPNAADLMALLDFKNRITEDPLGIMASWNDSSSHYCNWTGITCDPFGTRVQILNLRSQKLVGSLPPSIGNLSFLEGMELRNNTFRGKLPQEIGLLSSLKHLNLSNNMLSGSIPSILSNCTQLTIVFLEYNQLSGEIPRQLSSLSKLELFSVKANNMTGSFPDWIGNLSSRFTRLSLAENSFHGSIPPEIGRLSGLTLFHVFGNQFSGELPSSIYNLSSITNFSVAQNLLKGKIPADVGLKFPNLERYQCGMNNFTGEIPVSLTNASRLALLDFAVNSLTGTVPSVLGSLSFLYWINFEFNLLGNRQTGDMNFISSLTNCTNLQALGLLSNLFGGELPVALANLSTTLEMITLGENQMHGNIPVGIGNLENLTVLGLELNKFTGSIPDDIGKLQNLGILQLNGNELTGVIPISIGNLTSLNKLFLHNNRLQGNIPPQLGNCTRLLELNISSNNLTGSIPKEVVSLSSLSVVLGLARNSFSGPLPVEVSRLTNLKEFDVSGNNLSGEIPGSLSKCLSLELLLMGGNRFMGTVPGSLEALRGLEEIDFSHNNLSGKAPDFLGKLPFLKRLDLSYNNLEGVVPNQGIFSNASAVSVVGNRQLCGGDPSLHLSACSVLARKSNKNLKLIRWLIPVSVSVTVSIVLICFLTLWYVLRKPKKQPNSPSSPNDSHLVISYRELHRATNGFSADNLIGSGSFGSVYRAILGDIGSSVAVKVLKLEQKGAIKSFMDECTILRSIRHRNLLKIITACSGFDPQGQDFKCLVTEFMANGSLDTWLHPSRETKNAFPTRTLSVIERLNIAIDVASAVDYLHNYSHTPIIHCDLKPSNILLDEDLMAHVGDFGLAKFLLQSTSGTLQNNSISVQLRGSIGYIPPEYGASSKISTLGDVYSFGVVLLELFTGKRPTDDMFNNGVSIHKYVAMALPQHVMEVLDPSLILANEEEREMNDAGDIKEAYAADFQQFSNEIDCLVSVLKIGVSCSMSAPRDRMQISIVVNKLHSIRDQIHRATKQ